MDVVKFKQKPTVAALMTSRAIEVPAVSGRTMPRAFRCAILTDYVCQVISSFQADPD